MADISDLLPEKKEMLIECIGGPFDGVFICYNSFAPQYEMRMDGYLYELNVIHFGETDDYMEFFEVEYRYVPGG